MQLYCYSIHPIIIIIVIIILLSKTAINTYFVTYTLIASMSTMQSTFRPVYEDH